MIGAENFGDFGIDGVPSVRPNDLRFKDWRIGDGPQKPVAAYSFRRLNKFATRSMRVRRVADNALMDLGFIMDEPDLPALVAFSNGGDVAVVTLFDQMGNGHDFNQGDTTLQPLVVQAGLVIFDEGKPIIWFDGINDVLVNASGLNNFLSSEVNYTISLVFKLRAFAKGHNILRSSSSDNSRLSISTGGNGVSFRFSILKADATFNTLTWVISSNFRYISSYHNSPQTLFLMNQQSIDTAAITSQPNGLFVSLGGQANAATNLAAHLNFNEMIIYRDNELQLRRQIEFNQSNYYQIPLS